MNPWLEHIRLLRTANPQYTYKQAMIEAKKTYVKK